MPNYGVENYPENYLSELVTNDRLLSGDKASIIVDIYRAACLLNKTDLIYRLNIQFRSGYSPFRQYLLNNSETFIVADAQGEAPNRIAFHKEILTSQSDTFADWMRHTFGDSNKSEVRIPVSFIALKCVVEDMVYLNTYTDSLEHVNEIFHLLDMWGLKKQYRSFQQVLYNIRLKNLDGISFEDLLKLIRTAHLFSAHHLLQLIATQVAASNLAAFFVEKNDIYGAWKPFWCGWYKRITDDEIEPLTQTLLENIAENRYLICIPKVYHIVTVPENRFKSLYRKNDDLEAYKNLCMEILEKLIATFASCQRWSISNSYTFSIKMTFGGGLDELHWKNSIKFISMHCPVVKHFQCSGVMLVELNNLNLSNLESLVIDECCPKDLEMLPAILEQCENIQELTVKCDKSISMDNEIVSKISPALKNVKKIHINYKFDNDTLTTLLKGCENVEELTIGCYEQIHTDQGDKQLIHGKALKLRKSYIPNGIRYEWTTD